MIADANPKSLVDRILALPRPVKRLIALMIDAIICVVSVWFAFYLRIGELPPLTGAPSYPILASIALALPLFVSFGLYRAIFRYAEWHAIMTIARAVFIYAIPFAITYTAIGIDGVPRTIGLIQPLLLFLLIASSRTFVRVVLGESYTALWRAKDQPRVLIYGAGSAGRQLASAIASSHEMKLVGFIDDDARLWNSTMNGVPISGPDQLSAVIARRNATDILLAIPSATRARRGEIVHQLRDVGLHVRTLPAVLDIARGSVSVSDLKDLEIEDLLGRAPVPPDVDLLRTSIAGRVVLVTGAGGSIGSELCRQILSHNPAMLLLVDISEFNLYAIHQELSRAVVQGDGDNDGAVLLPLLASVYDERRMEEILATWQPDTIYHAAAYKHVPLVEHNALEGIRNNVFGTSVTAKLARKHGVRHFVLVSTDKAVRPTNIMGTSKRLAEMVLQAMHADGGTTCFSMVRFGNVLGSSGSVVPLFQEQIAAGGPITITHADIIRYFMTISEAAQLVLQAGGMALGGDVFVLDMGEPVRIIDLARNMIELSGLTVREDDSSGDIEIKVVGLRPGEKLYEELLIGNEPTPSSHPRILRSNERFLPWNELSRYLDMLSASLESGDAATARGLIRKIVPEYHPNSPFVDWVSNAKAATAAE
jgi:FlaA1/EpsC-like NDP-sugar epimerase